MSIEYEILDLLISDMDEFKNENFSSFTTSSISKIMHLSRSSASKYLNDLVRKDELIKINSRPVYFLPKKHIEKEYGIQLKENEYLSIGELMLLLESQHSLKEKIIGEKDSLKTAIDLMSATMSYKHLKDPVVIYGDLGVGKKFVINSLTRKEENTLIFDYLKSNDLDVDKLHTQIKEASKKKIVIIQYNGFSGLDKLEALLNLQALEEDLYVFIIFSGNKESLDQEAFLKDLPIKIYIPSFHERYYEEKVEIIMHIFKIQSKNLGVNFSISNTALELLVNAKYTQNIAELKREITRACLEEFSNLDVGKEILINTYNFKDYLLNYKEENLPQQLRYISVANYKRESKDLELFNYYNKILKYSTQDDFEQNVKKELNNISNYLLFDNDINIPDKTKYLLLVTSILAQLEKEYFLNLKFNFENIVSMLILIDNHYAKSIKDWQESKHKEIGALGSKTQSIYPNDTFLSEKLNDLVKRQAGFELNPITKLVISLLFEENNLKSHNNITGLIVCHGYATASSIANSVNTLLDQFIFDAIDMNLDVSSQEVINQIERYVARNTTTSEIIVLVDMGSLESIDLNFEKIGRKQIAMINNVSTKMALVVGSEIKNKTKLMDILEKATSSSVSEYKILKQEKNKDTILISSENGIHIANRLKDIFIKSLPDDVAIEVKTISENDLLIKGLEHELFKKKNVIFVSGTIDPGIKDVPYLSVESIIAGDESKMFVELLSKYITKEQTLKLINNIQKNFSLENVINYLTILNPVTLLDYVVDAVNRLETGLNTKLSGTTKVGLYIHASCLVERLLTHTFLDDKDNIEGFEKNNGEFIKVVRDSFMKLTSHYKIELPINEIYMISEYVMEDIKNTKDLMFDWIV